MQSRELMTAMECLLRCCCPCFMPEQVSRTESVAVVVRKNMQIFCGKPQILEGGWGGCMGGVWTGEMSATDAQRTLVVTHVV